MFFLEKDTFIEVPDPWTLYLSEKCPVTENTDILIVTKPKLVPVFLAVNLWLRGF